jgi:rod shape determining protein RodA
MNFLARYEEPRLVQKLFLMNWGLVLLLTMIGGIGFLALYSAGAGDIHKYADKHAVRFGAGLTLALITGLVSIRFWRQMAWPLYGIGILMLIYVDIRGHIGMGAQRWINLGFMQLQPSEIMKPALVMALAAYFEKKDITQISLLRTVIPALFIILAPVAVVVTQPDLGTGMALMLAGLAVLFAVGVSWWYFVLGAGAAAGIIPVAWHFLREYQRNRIRIFLDPDLDPLGTGYHITQSKIAMGSGGVTGKGFLQGTQSKLNFLPEKQTDFIFTLWSEEWGMIGGIVLLSLFMLTFIYGTLIALSCRYQYARILAMGLTINISIYVLINAGMVMGLLPVVGVPMPMVSHGGTAMLSVLFCYGLILSASIHRDVKVRQGFL